MNTVQVLGQAPEWTITDRLRKARELTGLDQAEFAREIGVSRGTVSNYERGAETHKRPYLLAWALGSGVSLEWLLTGQQTAPHPDGPSEGLKEPAPSPRAGSEVTRGYDAHAAISLGCAA